MLSELILGKVLSDLFLVAFIILSYFNFFHSSEQCYHYHEIQFRWYLRSIWWWWSSSFCLSCLGIQDTAVTNCSSPTVTQVKFSELTMDMFRMLQTLEREPQDDFNHIYDASPAPGRVPLVSNVAVLRHQKWPDWKVWMSKCPFEVQIEIYTMSYRYYMILIPLLRLFALSLINAVRDPSVLNYFQQLSVLLFWIVTPCGIEGRYQCFGETYYSIFSAEVPPKCWYIPASLHGVTTRTLTSLLP